MDTTDLNLHNVPKITISNSMRTMLDQLNNPFGIRDLSSRLIYSNDSFAHFLNCKSAKEIIGKHDRDIDSVFFNCDGIVEEFDKQYKKVSQTQKAFSTLEIHPHAIDYPYIFRKMPFYDDGNECVGMFGYNIQLPIYSLNDYVKGHMPGSMLLNKPDDFFTERECEIMFYRLQGLKAKEAAARLNLALTTFNNYMQRLYYKTGATNLDEFEEFCIKRNYNRYLPARFLTKEAITFSDSII